MFCKITIKWSGAGEKTYNVDSWKSLEEVIYKLLDEAYMDKDMRSKHCLAGLWNRITNGFSMIYCATIGNPKEGN